MTDVRSICAIGQRGQLGRDGRLPWEGAKGAEYVADVQRFFEVTRGHVLVAGPKTIASVPRFAYADRTIEVIRSRITRCLSPPALPCSTSAVRSSSRPTVWITRGSAGGGLNGRQGVRTSSEPSYRCSTSGISS